MKKYQNRGLRISPFKSVLLFARPWRPAVEYRATLPPCLGQFCLVMVLCRTVTAISLKEA